MSTPRNNVHIEKARISQVPIDFNNTYNSGDMLKWDAVNSKAVAMSASDMNSAASAAKFIGVAVDTQPITSLKQNLQVARMSVVTYGLVEFLVADNATYYPGDYVGVADAQSIVRCAGSSSTAIGVVAPENGYVGVAGGATVGITAVAGVTKLLIWLKPQYVNLLPF